MFFLLLLACGGEPHGNEPGAAPHGDAAHGEAGHGGPGHDHGAPAAGHDHGAPAAGHDHGAPAAGHDHAAGGHGAAPHAHSSGHGGEIKSVGDLHVEARFMKSGVMVWVSDAAEKPVDLSTVTAGAVVKGPAGVQNVPMAVMGDHLHAAVELPEGAPADAVLTITYQGKPISVDFRTQAVGSLAEHDHTSLHGGVVSMWGDYHVEYLAKDGEIRFWMSDAKRLTVKDGVSGSAKVGDTVVPLTFDAESGLLSGKATPAAGQRVMLDAKVGDKAFSLAFGG